MGPGVLAITEVRAGGSERGGLSGPGLPQLVSVYS